MSQPRILLLQARENDDPVIPEEVAIFARNAALPEDHVLPHNLLHTVPTLGQARAFDAVMIGGSGEYFVSKENLPAFHAILDFLRDLVESGMPMFASCFGFQLIVRAFGGEVSYRPDLMELGTYELALTPEGMADDLLGRLPPRFSAHLGHKDLATRFPQELVHLAYSKKAPFQALRIPGKPVWATKFHPELTHVENRARFKRYLDLYAKTMSPEELDSTVNRFRPGPETGVLIPGFMEIVFS